MKIGLSFLLLLLFAFPGYAADPLGEAQEHILLAEKHVRNGSLFAAVKEYRLAIDLGVEDAGIQQQLSILLYHQGFVEDAIESMEKAVTFDTETDYLHHELGLLYFARGRLDEAREQFLAGLKLNPGQSDSHYYLARIFKRQNHLLAARLFARSALDLGHSAPDLESIATSEGAALERDLWLKDDSKLYLRQILLDSRTDAEELLQRISDGEPFELFARDESLGGNRNRGGYAGGFSTTDLHPKIVSALTFVKNLSSPQVVELGVGVSLVQKMGPLDWGYIDALLPVSQEPDLEAVEHVNASLLAQTEQKAQFDGPALTEEPELSLPDSAASEDEDAGVAVESEALEAVPPSSDLDTAAPTLAASDSRAFRSVDPFLKQLDPLAEESEPLPVDTTLDEVEEAEPVVAADQETVETEEGVVPEEAEMIKEVDAEAPPVALAASVEKAASRDPSSEGSELLTQGSEASIPVGTAAEVAAASQAAPSIGERFMVPILELFTSQKEPDSEESSADQDRSEETALTPSERGETPEDDAEVKDEEKTVLISQVKAPEIVPEHQPTLYFKIPKRPAPPEKKKNFIVQVGAFRLKAYADERVKKLEKLGYESYLFEEIRNQVRWYITVADAYGSYTEAQAAVNHLKRRGVDAFVLWKR